MLSKKIGTNGEHDTWKIVDCWPESSAKLRVVAKQGESRDDVYLDIEPGGWALIQLRVRMDEKGNFTDKFWIYMDGDNQVEEAKLNGNALHFFPKTGFLRQTDEKHMTYGPYFVRPGDPGYLRAYSEDWRWNEHYGFVLSTYSGSGEYAESCRSIDPQAMATDNPEEANRNLRVMSEIIRLTRECNAVRNQVEQVAETIKNKLLERTDESPLVALMKEKGGVLRFVGLAVVRTLTEAYQYLRPNEAPLNPQQYLTP